MIDPALIPALHDVLVVTRTGSVGAAASRLNKTPSAVSQQLRRVQDALGIELFERSGRSLRLTAAGEQALPAITRLFDEAAAASEVLEALAGQPTAILRVACSDYLGKTLLVPVMREFARGGTAVRFEVTTAHSAASLKLVERGEVDLAIVTSAEVPASLGGRLLFEQRFAWVGPKLARPASFDERLRTEPVLRLAPESVGRRLLENHLSAQNITPLSTIDVPSVSLLLSYAQGGVGVGLAPALRPGDPAVRGLASKPAEVPALPVRLVHRKGWRPSAVAQRFVERLLKSAK